MAVTQNMLNALEWRCIGPPRGGRVVAVCNGKLCQIDTFGLM
jgi:hypothetical protein